MYGDAGIPRPYPAGSRPAVRHGAACCVGVSARTRRSRAEDGMAYLFLLGAIASEVFGTSLLKTTDLGGGH